MQPPAKRFRVFCHLAGATGLSAMIVAVAILFSHGPDPVCGGIRLSEILRNEHLWGMHRVSLDRGSPSSYTNLFSPREREFIRALHGMNESAWPVLMGDLRNKDSELGAWLVKFIGAEPFLPGGGALPGARRTVALLAIEELIRPQSERTREEDPAWRGIKEYPAPFRRRIVLDLAAALQARLDDAWLAPKICVLLGRAGSGGQTAAPALDQAARSGVRGASEMLAMVRRQPNED